jgi:hypothetical protein
MTPIVLRVFERTLRKTHSGFLAVTYPRMLY